MVLQLTTCPDRSCGVPAEVTDHFVLPSTGGLIEHVRTYCVRRHTFTVAAARIGADAVRS